MLLYVHRDPTRDGEPPRTSTSTFTHLLSSVWHWCFKFGTGREAAQDVHLDFHFIFFKHLSSVWHLSLIHI